ncbi:hypothetical protein TMatcc_001948 [Talaromyces marneffei ATCC 18224]
MLRASPGVHQSRLMYGRLCHPLTGNEDSWLEHGRTPVESDLHALWKYMWIAAYDSPSFAPRHTRIVRESYTAYLLEA